MRTAFSALVLPLVLAAPCVATPIATAPIGHVVGNAADPVRGYGAVG